MLIIVGKANDDYIQPDLPDEYENMLPLDYRYIESCKIYII